MGGRGRGEEKAALPPSVTNSLIDDNKEFVLTSPPPPPRFSGRIEDDYVFLWLAVPASSFPLSVLRSIRYLGQTATGDGARWIWMVDPTTQ